MRNPAGIVVTIIATAVVGGTEVFGGAMASSLPQAEDATYGTLSLRFEPYPTPDGSETFLSRGTDYAFVWHGDEAIVLLQRQGAAATDVRMRLLGAASNPPTRGTDPLPGKSHYFLGNDPKQWRTDVPHYARIRATDVYPGVDLVIYGNEQQLEYDFVLDPGVDPAVLTLGFDGADDVEVNERGDLVLHVPGGELIHRAPYAYQQVGDTEKEVASRYDLRPDGTVGFELLAAYDKGRPLVIDPVLVYSTYLGGEGIESGRDIAVDADGHAFVTGSTVSMDFDHLLFPITDGAFQEDPPMACLSIACTDAFVSKLTPAGDDLVYSTFLGGIGIDQGNGVAVDADGNAYIIGRTSEFSGPNDFPVTDGAAQPTTAGGSDAFLVKLDPSGNLLYSTYLGGSEWDVGNDIAVGDEGVAVLVGETGSTDFPVTADAFQDETDGEDGFLARIDTSGDTEGLASVLYATFLGGGTPVAPSGDVSANVVLDDVGNAWVSGTTWSPDFPTTENAYQRDSAGSRDLFLTAIDPTGNVPYSTYFGGSDYDTEGGLAVDGAGFVFLAGTTSSTDFPVTPLAFQTLMIDDGDAFVAKLDTGVAGPGALVYSTFLGGTGSSDGVRAIAIDDAGNAYVTGITGAPDFPLQDPLSCGYNGGLGDIIVSVLDPDGSSLVFSTFMGTPARFRESGEAIAVGPANNLYLTGTTDGDDSAFPITRGAFQELPPSGRDIAFVTKIDVWDPAPAGPVAFAGPDQELTCAITDGGMVTLDSGGSCDPTGGGIISYSWSGPFGIIEEPPTPTVQLPSGFSEVTLTVTNALGQTDSDTVAYNLLPGPLGFGEPLPPLVRCCQQHPEFFEKSFNYGRTLPLKMAMACGETVVDADPDDAPKLYGVFTKTFGDRFFPDEVDLDSGRSNDDGGQFRRVGDSWAYDLNTKDLAGPDLYYILVRLADGRMYWTGVRLD